MTDTSIVCPHRVTHLGETPCCRVVQELTDLPIIQCHTNDSACRWCLQSDVPPHSPNKATASMAVHSLGKVGRKPDARLTKPLTLAQTAIKIESIPCILRREQTREIECKPCQSRTGQTALVPVYGCTKHGECTLQNTGTSPRIRGCETCVDRIAVRNEPYPAAVLNVLKTPR